jgi:hypothetical protein
MSGDSERITGDSSLILVTEELPTMQKPIESWSVASQIVSKQGFIAVWGEPLRCNWTETFDGTGPLILSDQARRIPYENWTSIHDQTLEAVGAVCLPSRCAIHSGLVRPR